MLVSYISPHAHNIKKRGLSAEDQWTCLVCLLRGNVLVLLTEGFYSIHFEKYSLRFSHTKADHALIACPDFQNRFTLVLAFRCCHRCSSASFKAITVKLFVFKYLSIPCGCVFSIHHLGWAGHHLGWASSQSDAASGVFKSDHHLRTGHHTRLTPVAHASRRGRDLLLSIWKRIKHKRKKSLEIVYS